LAPLAAGPVRDYHGWGRAVTVDELLCVTLLDTAR
jgi:hypothetical protein